MSRTLWTDIAVDHQALLKQFEYLNHMNPHTFEVDDLDRLIKSVNLTANLYYIMSVEILLLYCYRLVNGMIYYGVDPGFKMG